MRCPAIEGIETRRRARTSVYSAPIVECVAPLLRGLKPADRPLHGVVHGADGSNALPRY